MKQKQPDGEGERMIQGRGIAYTPEEDAILLIGIEHKLTNEQIRLNLPGRTYWSVTRRRQTLNAVKRRQKRKALHGKSAAMRGDHKFKEAVIAAVHTGQEHVPFGIIKDRRPCGHPTSVPRPIPFSGCTSAAWACAELGEPDGTPRTHV